MQDQTPDPNQSEEKPDNLLSFLPEQEETAKPEEIPAPPFMVVFPPHPRSKPLQKLLDGYERVHPKRQERIMDAIEEFVAGIYFAQGSGRYEPEMPTVLTSLDPALLGLMVANVPPEFKRHHWAIGWNKRPQEEKDTIEKEMQQVKAEEGLYSHLPKIGEKMTVKGKSGNIEEHIVDEKLQTELRRMVDMGALAPAKPQKPQDPDFTSEEIANAIKIDKAIRRK
jgi:hypothetical protein